MKMNSYLVNAFSSVLDGGNPAGVVLDADDISPEQRLGSRVDARTDIYSTGAVMYELLTGEKARPGLSETTLWNKIVDGETAGADSGDAKTQRMCKLVVFKALAKDPDDRFASAQEFLDREPTDAPGCIVLDLKMPGVTGLQLQEDLTTAGINLPIVFLTGHGDVPASVTAMKGGAVDFFEKPVDEDELMDAIKQAVDWDVHTRERRIEQIEVQSRLNTLTPRELQVFGLVVQGNLNKQIACELGMSEKTVKVHRARVMQKMQAESLAGLVRLAERTGTQSLTPATLPAG